MLLHAHNQRYKRLKINNDQNDRSGNSSLKTRRLCTGGWDDFIMW